MPLINRNVRLAVGVGYSYGGGIAGSRPIGNEFQDFGPTFYPQDTQGVPTDGGPWIDPVKCINPATIFPDLVLGNRALSTAQADRINVTAPAATPSLFIQQSDVVAAKKSVDSSPAFLYPIVAPVTFFGPFGTNETPIVVRRSPEGLFALEIRLNDVGTIPWFDQQSDVIYPKVNVAEGAFAIKPFGIDKISWWAPPIDVVRRIPPAAVGDYSFIVRLNDVGTISWFDQQSDVIRNPKLVPEGFFALKSLGLDRLAWWAPPIDVVRRIPPAAEGFYSLIIRLNDVGTIPWFNQQANILRNPALVSEGFSALNPRGVDNLAWWAPPIDVMRRVPPAAEGFYALRIRQEDVGTIPWFDQQADVVVNPKLVPEGFFRLNPLGVDRLAWWAPSIDVIRRTPPAAEGFYSLLIRENDVGQIPWFNQQSNVIRQLEILREGAFAAPFFIPPLDRLAWWAPPIDVIRRVPPAAEGYFSLVIRENDVGTVSWFHQQADVVRRFEIIREGLFTTRPFSLDRLAWWTPPIDVIRHTPPAAEGFHSLVIRENDVGTIPWFDQQADVIRRSELVREGAFAIRPFSIDRLAWWAPPIDVVRRIPPAAEGWFDLVIREDDVGQIPWFNQHTDVIKRIPLAAIGDYRLIILETDVGQIPWWVAPPDVIRRIHTTATGITTKDPVPVVPEILFHVDSTVVRKLHQVLETEETYPLQPGINVYTPLENGYLGFRYDIIAPSGGYVGPIFIPPSVSGAAMAIFSPDETPLAQSVKLSVEYLVAGVPVFFDAPGPTIRIYHLDALGNEVIDVPITVMTQYGVNPAWYIDWTPLTNGIHMLDISGTYLGTGIERTQAVTVRPKFDPIAIALSDILVSRM